MDDTRYSGNSQLAMKLSVSQMVFNAIQQFSNLFINLFLYRIYGNVQVVAQYNIFVFLSWLIFFYIGLKLSESNHRKGMAAAGAMCGVAVISLLLGNENPYVLGFIMGRWEVFSGLRICSCIRRWGQEARQAVHLPDNPF